MDGVTSSISAAGRSGAAPDSMPGMSAGSRCGRIPSSISALGSNRYQAQGTLRIRNIDRPIAIEFTSVDQPGGQTMIESQFEINRTEFGIGGGVWNEKGVVAEQIPVKVKLLLAPLGQSRLPGR